MTSKDAISAHVNWKLPDKDRSSHSRSQPEDHRRNGDATMRETLPPSLDT